MKQHRAAQALVVMTLLRGLIALTLTLIVLLGGERAGRMLGNFIALYIFASGAITLRWWYAYDRKAALPGLAGALGLVTGLVGLGRFVLGDLVPREMAAEIIGIFALLTGWTHIVGGFDTPGTAHQFRLLESVLLGGFELLLGILLILAPALAEAPTRPPLVTALLVGWGLVGGVTLLGEAWQREAQLRAGRHAGVTDEGNPA
jgi:uncharacterized membrane protein HdeD (DUF308 family)